MRRAQISSPLRSLYLWHSAHEQMNVISLKTHKEKE
jgi:hypothetical protein